MHDPLVRAGPDTGVALPAEAGLADSGRCANLGAPLGLWIRRHDASGSLVLWLALMPGLAADGRLVGRGRSRSPRRPVQYMATSSSGLGRRPLKAVAPFQIRSGLLMK